MYSEIRESTKITLLNKVIKHDYGNYLLKININRIRGFDSEDITFQFPVTALIGPNGSGKSSVLGAAGCAYKSIKPSVFFPKSAIGDESMSGWRAEYEVIDKRANQKQPVKRSSNFRQAKWVRGDVLERDVLFFGIERTVPAGEKTKFKKLTRSTYRHGKEINVISQTTATQIEHILGKSVSEYKVTDVGHDEDFFIGSQSGMQYSEFHFGAGESSIIRMITEIEKAPANSLILIEEIENGLHPVATRRMVEYLIDAASRKSIQAVFTTHSDYALDPLPNEAIWACINGSLRQGKLSVESLRAVSGRIDKKLAIFVEDEFAKHWVDTILREHLGAAYDQIEVHAVAGDGNAVKTHLAQQSNPAVEFNSLCVIDGDSRQVDDWDNGILRLPGEQPELTVYDFVKSRLNTDLAILTVSCQRDPSKQSEVEAGVNEIILTNRDPHLLFSQLGIKIGFVPENIIRGAFLAIWVRNNAEYCNRITEIIKSKIS